MQTRYQYFRKLLSSSLLLLLLFSCHHFDSKEVSDEYKKYRFDPAVISKLPVYDSLASSILEQYSYFRQYIKETDAYRSYKYMPNSNESDVYKKLPVEISSKIDLYFTKLGNDFVLGFTVYIDSSIKINVRNRPSETSQLNVEENLSYYPQKINIQRREYPVKDTILNPHWQYWVRFNKQGLF